MRDASATVNLDLYDRACPFTSYGKEAPTCPFAIPFHPSV